MPRSDAKTGSRFLCSVNTLWPDQVVDATAGMDGADRYICSWDHGTEWDLQPGQNVAASYREPEADGVYGSLELDGRYACTLR